jgi:hypothetical protein
MVIARARICAARSRQCFGSPVSRVGIDRPIAQTDQGAGRFGHLASEGASKRNCGRAAWRIKNRLTRFIEPVAADRGNSYLVSQRPPPLARSARSPSAVVLWRWQDRGCFAQTVSALPPVGDGIPNLLARFSARPRLVPTWAQLAAPTTSMRQPDRHTMRGAWPSDGRLPGPPPTR